MWNVFNSKLNFNKWVILTIRDKSMHIHYLPLSLLTSTLMSMPGCSTKKSTRPMWPFIKAKLNGVIYWKEGYIHTGFSQFMQKNTN